MRGIKKDPPFVDTLAGDTKEGLDDAAALPDRLSRYSQAHRRALLMADYIRNVQPDKKNLHLASELSSCGSYLVFRDYFRIGKIRLHSMKSCRKHILCPLCAIRRGAKSVKAYLDRLEVIRQSHPTLKAFLVTFTVKNGHDLPERFRHLQKSLKSYHQQRNFALKDLRTPVQACKASGAVWSYEFKRGTGSGLWHPHVHSVWLCDAPPDQNVIREEWKSITRDSYIVDVRPFHDQDDLVGGFLEVFKYALKFSDMPLEQNWEGYESLSGRRLIGSFGLFRGVDVPDSMTDEGLEDQPYIELFYRYIQGSGYSCTHVSEASDPQTEFGGSSVCQ